MLKECVVNECLQLFMCLWFRMSKLYTFDALHIVFKVNKCLIDSRSHQELYMGLRLHLWEVAYLKMK